MKKVRIEMWFDDDFVPPNYFEEPCEANYWTSECQKCPLFSWVDDCDGMSSGDCHFPGQWEETDGKYQCPLNKYFVKEA